MVVRTIKIDWIPRPPHNRGSRQIALCILPPLHIPTRRFWTECTRKPSVASASGTHFLRGISATRRANALTIAPLSLGIVTEITTLRHPKIDCMDRCPSVPRSTTYPTATFHALTTNDPTALPHHTATPSRVFLYTPGAPYTVYTAIVCKFVITILL